MQDKIAIHWFRQDLRLNDNPALNYAAQNGKVIPVYILDDINSKNFKMGAASKVWLNQSLLALNKSLNNQLQVFSGDPFKILTELIKKHKVSVITWNRCYEPWAISRDKKIKAGLSKGNIDVKTFNGSLLWEPFEILNNQKSYYKVFTAFYKAACKYKEPDLPQKKSRISLFETKNSTAIKDLKLLPDINWYEDVLKNWQIGESFASKKLEKFLKAGIKDYKNGRDFPAQNNVSKLSPHLHFGEISPHQIWHEVKNLAQDTNTQHFLSELGWREFSYYLLYYFPQLPTDNFQSKFNNFAWKKNKQNLIAWQTGQTGVPIVDAGMRELYATGWMHNRVRMIVGSYLIKNLLINWREGEAWFWDCLLDADLAANSASWQWVAGSGADAAPYFRIFNPVTQAQKFDPKGEYIKKWVPEIAKLSDKYLPCPWEAPTEELLKAKIQLGKTYPKPLVDLKESRQLALANFKKL